MPKSIKPFLTYEKQINHLIDSKGLIIENKEFAQSILEQVSYYALIGGYKNLFYDKMTRKYISGTTFEDIYLLYHFDDALRDIVFKYIRVIEQQMRSLISYYFCEKYSNNQAEYLNPANYVNTRRNKTSIPKLISILNYAANKDIEHEYIVYQRSTYGNVPLWAVMKTLTLGQTSKMFSLLKPDVKSRICRRFTGVSDAELVMYLRVLTHFRNVCAHNERLFTYTDRYDIPNTVLHQKLSIPLNGNQYAMGKRDLFAVVISFRYLLSNEDFKEFKKDILTLIRKTAKKSDNLSEHLLESAMHFPDNWKLITRYHK